MAFDENGNYILSSGDFNSPYTPQGGYGSQRVGGGRSFLNYFNPMQGQQQGFGSNRKKSLLGGFASMSGQGGFAGGFGKVAGFLL